MSKVIVVQSKCEVTGKFGFLKIFLMSSTVQLIWLSELNGYNEIKCVSMGHQKCTVRPL